MYLDKNQASTQHTLFFLKLSQQNPQHLLFCGVHWKHVHVFLSASTQHHCPRTACPRYPHMICSLVFFPGWCHTCCTEMHKRIHTTHHQAHRTNHPDVTKKNTDFSHEPTAEARRHRSSTGCSALQSALRGDASHTLTTPHTGKAAPFEYSLFSSVWFTFFFSPMAIMSFASHTSASFKSACFRMTARKICFFLKCHRFASSMRSDRKMCRKYSPLCSSAEKLWRYCDPEDKPFEIPSASFEITEYVAVESLVLLGECARILEADYVVHCFPTTTWLNLRTPTASTCLLQDCASGAVPDSTYVLIQASSYLRANSLLSENVLARTPWQVSIHLCFVSFKMAVLFESPDFHALETRQTSSVHCRLPLA